MTKQFSSTITGRKHNDTSDKEEILKKRNEKNQRRDSFICQKENEIQMLISVQFTKQNKQTISTVTQLSVTATLGNCRMVFYV